MATKQDLKNAINFDFDFIAMPRYKCSLKKLIEKNPNGVSDELAAQALCLDVEQFNQVYSSAFSKLRSALGHD